MLIYFFLFFIGICVGSFLNVVIDRFPKGESLILGRSHCDHCGRKLTFIDLIPVFSYLMLQGKCRTCKKVLSLQYPLIEMLTGFAFIIAFYFLGHSTSWQSIITLVSSLGIVSALIVIFVADYKYHLIPDIATASLFLFSFGISGSFNSIFERFGAAVILFVILLLIHLGTKGRGLGFGDVKLAGAMGFVLGLIPGLVALYLAFVIGGIFGLVLIVSGKRGLKSKIAFGPFLVIGTATMFFFSGPVISFLTNIFGF